MNSETNTITVDAPTLTIRNTYNPLALQYTSPDAARSWQLTFQLRPDAMIKFSGDTPTRDEIIATLGPIGAPVWMIEVIEVVIATVQSSSHNSN